MKRPNAWNEVTLKQYSDYNELIIKYQDKIKDLNPEDANDANIILLEELDFQHDSYVLFSGLTKSTVNKKEISDIRSYCEGLKFLQTPPKEKELKKFSFKGVDYSMPENVRLNTKYGQYVEAMQSEMVWRAQNKNSLMYLAHQLAHQVDNGEEWNQEERDKLAIEFEDLTMDVFLDFSFFLHKQSVIYTTAYLNHTKKLALKKAPLKERVLVGWDTLKQCMNWQGMVLLKSIIKLRLTVFYIHLRERFLHIWGT